MMKLFGTDGIRGKANIFPMTPEFVMRLAKTLGYIITKENKAKVFIGMDTRISAWMLESSFIAGLASCGVDVLRLGVIPTPAVAYFTRSFKATCGVVISASHNPYDEIGIKIFGKDGFKLDEALEKKIETLVDKELIFTSNCVGKILDFPNAIPTYIRFLLSTVNKDFSCKGMKIIIDCANGAVYKVAERLFNNLQAEVVFMNAKPNGFNINKDCGALYPEGLRKAVIENNADLGLAFDGDGDRLILIDKKGNIRDGDDILYISAKYLKEKNRLKNNKIVATIMSNLALELKLKDLDIEVIRCPVGDRFVAEAMCREDTILGGESSGHIIFFEYNITGDGLLSALQVLKIMHKTNKDLHILCDDFKKFPQVLLNIPVRQKRQIEELPKTYEIVKEFKKIYKSNLRIIVRPSGTENLMRVMVEGDDMTKIKKIAEDIASAITEDDKNNK